MTREEIVTYEVAKLAKEKGFDENCSYVYNNDRVLLGGKGVRCWHKVEFTAPTQSLLQRWLREEKNIHIEIVATACGYFWIADETNGTAITDSDILDRGTNEGGCFDTYELALEDALKYALENIQI